jgi:hypothetical protein
MAMPQKIEVWFLSIDKKTSYNQIPGIKYLGEVATACQRMGEYCFDPQLGLYKPGSEKNGEVESVEAVEFTQTQDIEQIDHATSLDRQVVNCDGTSFFDIFCGSAKKPGKAKHKLEIWIDVSHTMKQIDYAGEGKGAMCKRQSFLEILDLSCPLHKAYEVQLFNETLRQMGMKDQTCLNFGLNNQERLMKKVTESKIPHLIIITDIFEASEKFITFFEKQNALIKGIEKPLYAKDLKGLVKVAASYCK